MQKALFVSAFALFYVVDFANIVGVNLMSIRDSILFGGSARQHQRVVLKVRSMPQHAFEEVVSDLAGSAIADDKPVVSDCNAEGNIVTVSFSDGVTKSFTCESGTNGCCLSAEDNAPGCVQNLSCHRIATVD